MGVLNTENESKLISKINGIRLKLYGRIPKYEITEDVSKLCIKLYYTKLLSGEDNYIYSELFEAVDGFSFYGISIDDANKEVKIYYNRR